MTPFLEEHGAATGLLVATLLGGLVAEWAEERVLERQLGEPYRRYEARTSRLVPGIW